MKERPIIFSAPMVRAILAGRKTVTRRMVMPRTGFIRGPLGGDITEIFQSKSGQWILRAKDGIVGGLLCPYGQPGDQLWVREAWRARALGGDPGTRHHATPGTGVGIAYPADNSGINFNQPDWCTLNPRASVRPSIHMPRWASRLSLEVTGIRVERLQDITAEEAIAEGIEWFDEFRIDDRLPPIAFRALWESINGAGSWDLNPWVWVVEFKKAGLHEAQG